MVAAPAQALTSSSSQALSCSALQADSRCHSWSDTSIVSSSQPEGAAPGTAHAGWSNGTTPAAGSPTATVAITAAGMAYLAYDLPAQVDGTTVKVLVQTRTGSVYSVPGSVLTITADAAGPSAPVNGEGF